MRRKVLHILVIAILALNLAGVWAFASAFDCGMACCEPGEAARAGIPILEAPSCCQVDGVTCGFETGQYNELFDTAICYHNRVQKIAGEWDLIISSNLFPPSPTLRFPPSERSTGPPQSTPLYLSNAVFLC